MLTGFALQVEHIKLCARRNYLQERIKIEGFTPEVMSKILKLNADVNDLEQRTNEELVKLGLKQ